MTAGITTVDGTTDYMEDTALPASLAMLPIELLTQILNFLSSSHILNFALVSKFCCNFALPHVYKSISWIVGFEHARHCAASKRGVEFLVAHPEILPGIRSLRVSEKNFINKFDTKAYIDYSRNDGPIQPPHETSKYQRSRIGAPTSQNFAATFHATNSVLNILPSLCGLTELTLRSIGLPRTFYQNLHALSDLNLRRLTLRDCRLTTRYPVGYDPARLQITELSIFSMYSQLPKLKALLKLARSPILHTLRLDRSLERALASLVVYGLPPSVHSLELDWRGIANQGRLPYKWLFFFLNSCKYVLHLELTDMGKMDAMTSYPRNMRLSPNALPSLTSITVPPTLLELLLPGRAIDSITITDTTLRDNNSMNPLIMFLGLNEIADILGLLQQTSTSLQSLKFNLRHWDKELFYMLASQQKNLKELHVSYQYGEVDDTFFMTLGNNIEFLHLECLHLYRFGDKMSGREDDRLVDHQEYVIIWQLHMPYLREVALSSDIIWMHSSLPQHSPGGRKIKPDWTRYSVKPMNGVDGLLVVPCPKEAKLYEAASIRHRSNA